MKVVYFRFLFLLAALFSMPRHVKAQAEYLVTSPVRLTMGEGDSLILGTDHFTIVSLNDNSGEFTARFSLSAFMPHFISADSAAAIDKSALLLTFKGRFPIGSFSFYNDRSDTKSYTMNGMLTMNEVSGPYTLYFNVSVPFGSAVLDDEACNPYCYDYFPARIYFLISFKLSDFGIKVNLKTAGTEKVFVEVGGGIINKQY